MSTASSVLPRPRRPRAPSAPGSPRATPFPASPAHPAFICSRHSPRSPFPALIAAIALREASPARAGTVTAAVASAPGPARAAALLGRAPGPRAPRAADWWPPQPAWRHPQYGAAARRDWPRAAKVRPPLARAAGGSRRPGRAWVALLDGGGGCAVRVSLLWSGCGQLGQATGAGGRCGARGAPRGPAGGRCGLREGAPFHSRAGGRGRRGGREGGRARGGPGHAESRPL